ncbi:HPr family phosphocarrier protein [Texcoconibacillus texcoconensis]|uniref:Phosphotransferase system HPr (HPr) family protein n=1 Tax=Texcoconibacillus texcoconensis TaxID=1095777 RepID=A0A840QR57_9BACI|nr:HPr family phosphocarrier protein [Texcoconibacillus texcoconensis]MBB5173839.1 phosphotransferase system HPr (HPr) family protein [Texcoconibacillus texcoconensis]
MEEYKRDIIINIEEKQTIVELSQMLTPFKSEVYLINRSGGHVVEANVKSLLGLISMQIHNGDQVTVRTVGSDAKEALNKIIQFLT